MRGHTAATACRFALPGLVGLGICAGALAKPLFHLECIPPTKKLAADFAFAINDNGVVAGLMRNNERSCFKYADGVLTELRDSADTNCAAINNAGDIAGTGNLMDSIEHAVVWQADGSRWRVKANTTAQDINNNGQVAVYTNRETGPHTAYLYTRTDRTKLGTLGGNSSAALGLNDAAVVVGGSLDAAGQWRAFEWQDGTMKEICHREGATATEATRISSTGRRLCTADTPTGTVAYLEEADGSQRDIPGLDGAYWTPRDMNESGQVVGGSGGGPPVYFDGTNTYNLAKLADAASGDLRMSYAYAINRHGVIVGKGRISQQGDCAVIATPVAP